MAVRLKANEVDELRRAVAVKGGACGQVPTPALERLLETIGDVDLAADALTMDPRPQWLDELIGG